MLQCHVVIFMKNTRSRVYDVVVAGGGAAGLVASIVAARRGADVLLIEYNDVLGKKILATGNGKCNYTNRNLRLEHYFGAKPSFLEQVFATFGEKDTEQFFLELGIEPSEKDGLLYPRSYQAKSVQMALIREVKRLSISTVLKQQVKRIEKNEEGFCVATAEKLTYQARNVILACGGKASAISGSRGDGYYLASCLGHTIVPQAPALVQLHCEDALMAQANGVRCDAGISTWIAGERVAFWQGELQITDYGISGIVVFQASRQAAYACAAGKEVYCEIDFLPEYRDDEAIKMLQRRLCCYGKEKTLAQALEGLIQDKLIPPVLKRAHLQGDSDAAQCTKDMITMLLGALRHYKIKVIDTHGFQHAQVTAGGIDTKQISPTTMESLLVPGLFFAGEIVDVDGICGGYNLQWAWSSGAIAGMHSKRNIT